MDSAYVHTRGLVALGGNVGEFRESVTILMNFGKSADGEKEHLDGMRETQEGAYRPLACKQSYIGEFVCRQQIDWIGGILANSMFSYRDTIDESLC